MVAETFGNEEVGLDFHGTPSHDHLLGQAAEVGRLLMGLINHLRTTIEARS